MLQVTQHITLTAAAGAIVLTGSDAGLSTTARGNPVLTGGAGRDRLDGQDDAGLIYTPAAAIDRVLTAAPGAIVVTGVSALLRLTRAPFVMPPPGRLEFGQRVFIPGRW